MEIKANELRIGNYIYLSDKNKYWQIHDGHEIDECDKNPFVQPIPLTEEILLNNCNFEKIKGWDDQCYLRLKGETNSECFELFETNQGYEMPSGKICDTLHLLQNAYYFHELKELEINL